MATLKALRPLSLAALFALAAFGCAKGSPATSSPAPSRIVPPRLMTRASAPELVVSSSNAAGRPSLRMRIQVMVDSLGQADLRTLKVTGVVDTQNRLAVERWLQGLRFRPATLEGQPVSGLIDITLSVRVVQQR